MVQLSQGSYFADLQFFYRHFSLNLADNEKKNQVQKNQVHSPLIDSKNVIKGFFDLIYEKSHDRFYPEIGTFRHESESMETCKLFWKKLSLAIDSEYSFDKQVVSF